MTKPWRDVINIEERTGKRGGEMFYLTLSCGHNTEVRIRPFNITRIFAGKKPFVQTAPHRCKCWVCGAMGRR